MSERDDRRAEGREGQTDRREDSMPPIPKPSSVGGEPVLKEDEPSGGEATSVEDRQAEVADLQRELKEGAERESGRESAKRSERESGKKVCERSERAKRSEADSGWFSKIVDGVKLGNGVKGREDDRVLRLQESLRGANEKSLRLFAEMDNMKKRQAKEISDLRKFSLENFMKDLLCVCDSFAKGLGVERGAGDEDFAAFVAGMKMVDEQFRDILRRHGLEVVRSEGKEFDPRVHQAVQRVESRDVQVEMVQKEFACGYLLCGRLIRPAMVSVLVPCAPLPEPPPPPPPPS